MEDKDLQREHWAFCQALKKYRELTSGQDVKLPHVIKSLCHICGDDTGEHTPDCTSYIYGITNGPNVL